MLNGTLIHTVTFEPVNNTTTAKLRTKQLLFDICMDAYTDSFSQTIFVKMPSFTVQYCYRSGHEFIAQHIANMSIFPTNQELSEV